MDETLKSGLKTVKSLIGDGDIDGAFKALAALDEQFSLQLGGELLQLSARYNKNERDRRMNVVAKADYDLTSSQVISALLTLTVEAKAQPVPAPKPKPNPTPPTPPSTSGPQELVVLYHLDDAPQAQKLDMQLKILTRAGKIKIFFQHKSVIEGDRAAQQKAAIDRARLVGVLASGSFFYEDENFDLLDYAKGQGKSIVPILVKAFSIKGTGLEGLVGLPSNGTFVDNWQNQDSAWLNIADGLRAVLVPGG